MRKHLFHVILFIILTQLVYLYSCSVVELDTPQNSNNPAPGNGNGPSSGTVTGPDSLPGDAATFFTLLTNDSTKAWEATQFTIEGMSGFQDCRLDDTMILNADNTYSFNGGDEPCGGGAEEQTNGTWRLDFENRRLIFTLGDDEFQGTVAGINQNTVVLTGDFIGLDIAGRYDTP